MQSELKACPWCRAQPEIVRSLTSGLYGPMADHDMDCPIYLNGFIEYHDRQKAVDAWNHRADDWIPYNKGDELERGWYLVTVEWSDGKRDTRIDVYAGNGFWMTFDKYVIAYKSLDAPYIGEE